MIIIYHYWTYSKKLHNNIKDSTIWYKIETPTHNSNFLSKLMSFRKSKKKKVNTEFKIKEQIQNNAILVLRFIYPL